MKQTGYLPSRSLYISCYDFSFAQSVRQLAKKFHERENLKRLEQNRINQKQNFAAKDKQKMLPKNQRNFIFYHHEVMIFERKFAHQTRLPAAVQNKPDKLRRPRSASTAAVINMRVRNIQTFIPRELQSPRQIHVFFIRDKIFIEIFEGAVFFGDFYLFERAPAVHGGRSRRPKYFHISVILTLINLPLPAVNHAPCPKHFHAGAVKDSGF